MTRCVGGRGRHLDLWEGAKSQAPLHHSKGAALFLTYPVGQGPEVRSGFLGLLGSFLPQPLFWEQRLAHALVDVP